ncbi:YihY/virulence factor BrkB family protein [Salinibacterium hongtaonis]|nr:YihY/virulence factor BrkB family protein [Salinibacterium hongtaonis]
MVSIPERVNKVIAWVTALRPVRVFMHYVENRGPILAAGLAFNAIFAVFAALWVAFAVAGLVISAHPDVQSAFYALLDSAIPGLIDTGDGNGAIDPDDLESASVLGWTGAIALGGLVFTALGWLAACRDAVRLLFDLPGEKLNPVLLKLKDAGLGLAFGAAILVSAALLVFSTQAVGSLLDAWNVPETLASLIEGRALGLILMFALDTVSLAALYRLLSGLSIPAKRLWVGAMIGGAAFGVLKILGSALLGGATNNPLLASFAVIIGLLIWFNLMCQVILLGASWIAVGMADSGLIADPRIAREREDARLAEASRAAEKRGEAERRVTELKRRRRWGWARRLFRRHASPSTHEDAGRAATTDQHHDGGRR